jgi:hypothetical protein
VNKAHLLKKQNSPPIPVLLSAKKLRKLLCLSELKVPFAMSSVTFEKKSVLVGYTVLPPPRLSNDVPSMLNNRPALKGLKIVAMRRCSSVSYDLAKDTPWKSCPGARTIVLAVADGGTSVCGSGRCVSAAHFASLPR